MLFHQAWSQSSEVRSENFILRWRKFSATFLRLLLVALCGGVVYGSPSAQETAAGICPAPDTNGSSLITEYSIPTENSAPTGIAMGPDGALWYGTAYGTNIGRITTDGTFTEYPFPLAHDGDQRFLAAGPDGAVWFTDDWQNMIGRISSDGTITEYPIPSSVPDTDARDVAYMTSLPRGLVTGADGAMWFTEAFANNIGRITVDGEVTEYPLPTAQSVPVGLALGSDGAVWFVEKTANQIGRITTDGVITEYPIPTRASTPLRIAAGSDGALWFTEYDGNKIGRITTDGEFTEYSLPNIGSNPVGIVAGFGAIWFTEYNGNKIGCITLDGQITEYEVPTAHSVPFSIVAGSDGAVWFTEQSGHKIGRLQVQAAPTETILTSPQTVTSFSPQSFTLPMTFSFGAEWHIAEEYADVVSLASTGFDGYLSFIVPSSIEVSGPLSPFYPIPFPDDFVTWIQAHDLFQVVNTQAVVVGGLDGIQIDADATQACGTKKNWLFLASTGWNCALGVHYHFIYMDDVYGNDLLIMLEGYASPQEFVSKVEASQEVLDTLVFTH
jgi:virginiamycin B lyase